MSTLDTALVQSQQPIPAVCTELSQPLDREQLLLENLPSVRFIARKLHQTLPRHIELDDLISAGMIGLMEACNRFDPLRHVQFKSFAQFRIRGAILDWLRSLDWGPRELRRKARAVAEATRALTLQIGRTPSQQEIADFIGMTVNELQQLAGELRSVDLGSLNAEHGKDEEDEQLDFVPAPSEENPLFLCIAGESRERLITAIEALPEKERLVLTLYYYEELTMREIGTTLGVVESRVSQIHSAALRSLRSALGAAPKPAARASRARARRSAAA